MTRSDRFIEILRVGNILPNPPIPEWERWKASLGPEFYPFVRKLGGVSLFDFEGFDPEIYSAEFPLSSWRQFVPYVKRWGEAVWIEIDRNKIADNFLSGDELLPKWNAGNDQRHTIMPRIEAAHIEPISVVAFCQALIVRSNNSAFEKVTTNP